MKKIAFLLFVPLFVFTAMLAKNTDSGTKTMPVVQKLTPLPEQDIDLEAIQAQRATRYKLDEIKALQSQRFRLQQTRPIRQHRLSKVIDFSTYSRDSFSESYAPSINAVLAKSLAAQPTISVLINGVSDAIITQGDSIVITVTFSEGITEAEVGFWIDMDGDQVLDDTVDIDIADIDEEGGGGTIIDGDFEDETPPADGIYQATMPADEGPGGVAGLRFLIVATEASGAADTAAGFIDPEITTWSVSGTVTPNVANVLIGAFPSGEMTEGSKDEPRMTVTNPDGTYQLYLPEAGMYEVFSFDFLGAQKGLLPDTAYHNVDLTATPAHESLYDFNFVEPTSFVEGIVNNQDGFAVPGVMVIAGGEGGPSVGVETNEAGYYHIGVLPGWYWIGVDHSVLPEYMIPHGEEIFIEEGATETVNFNLYEADATISGMVTLDGAPLPGLKIAAWGEPVGYTRTRTEEDGSYILQVSSRVNEWGYNIWPEDQPDQTYFTAKLWEIPPGASGVNINFVTAAGGFTGYVTDAATPTDTLYEVGIMVRNTATEDEYHTGIDWETGKYLIYVPDGTYEINAFAHEYSRYTSSPIAVSGVVKTHNIALSRIVFDASISGTITDCEAGFALAGAGVGIHSPDLDYGDWTETDSIGNFYFDVPHGNYDVWADMPGYHGHWMQVIAPLDGNADASLCLTKFDFLPPAITSVIDRGRFDHPDDEPDQGGWAYLNFHSGGTKGGPFIGWSIWRVPGPDYHPNEMVNIGFLLFHGEENNTVLVPTRADSGAAYPTPAQYMSHYVVTGYFPGEGFEWFDSEVGSGYSVDNIAPGVPAGVQIAAATSGVQLSWDASADDDFQYFAVYRSDVSGSYGTAPYAAVEVNTFTDESLTAGTDYYYVVQAVDANGNESVFSAEVNSAAVNVADGLSIPEIYALGANYPNPFNPSTTITYQLPEAGYVNLRVYDLTGKVVNTLVGEYRPAGYHQVVWNGRDSMGASVATGVYFYHIVVGQSYTETRKMVLIK